jgi:hypothetical protein
VVLVATPFVAFATMQGVIWGFNEVLVPTMIDSVQEVGDNEAAPEDGARSTEPDEPPISVQTGLLISAAIAAMATLRTAASLWGSRRSTEAWAKGAAGERRTASDLARLPTAFVVLHDLRMPGSRANIDHLVIGPTGVFTVETKSYAKGVQIKGKRAMTGGRSMDAAIAQAHRQAETMAGVLGHEVRPVICVQDGPLELGWLSRPTVAGVRFTTGKRLARVLAEGPTILDAVTIASISSPGATAGRQRAPKSATRPTSVTPTAPGPPNPATAVGGERRCACGAPQVLRKRRSDGNPFWGCSTYPRCRLTSPA